MPTDFNDSNITPEFDKYFDDNDDGSPRMPEAHVIKIEPTPEVGANYTNVEIMLLHMPSMERSRVISHKRNSNGNSIGNANANPILDSRCYEVQFDDDVMAELDANIFVASMHAQCDPDVNQYYWLS